MSKRRLQGLTLLGGACLLFILTEVGELRFHWTPLLVGLAYLAAATIGGPGGSYWATAIVITGWGAAVALLAETSIDITTSAGYLVAVGLAALVAGALQRRGYRTDSMAVGTAVAGAGVAFALAPHVEIVGESWFWAAAVATVGAVRVAMPRDAGPPEPAAAAERA